VVDDLDLRALEAFDTPTICNALEMIEPARRRFGYTTSNVTCANADLGPRVGLAFTATMRSAEPPRLSGDALKAERLRYYKYVASDPDVPKVIVMQDLDGDQAGRGPFWGEFNTRIHQALGFRAVVTDGSIRDITGMPEDLLVLARGLRPSHAFVHIAGFGSQVNVFGMVVEHGDVVHADVHGAVSFPLAWTTRVAECARAFVAEEAPVMEACKRGRITYDELADLYMQRGASRSTPNGS
jgi:regulator of RNase E activity RraA